MDNYSLEIDPPAANDKEPLGYRALKPKPTLVVGQISGEIEHVKKPPFQLDFKHGEQIRPVAPFLEVFAVTENDKIEPLTVKLLQENGFGVRDVSWKVSVANRKVARRTGDEDDVVATGDVTIRDHRVVTLHGYCPKRFASKTDSIVFGSARFIKPNRNHQEIRLRFTPAKGLIYGPRTEPTREESGEKASDDDTKRDRPYQIPDGQSVYDPDKGGIWAGYTDISDDPDGKDTDDEKTKVLKERRKKIWRKNGWKAITTTKPSRRPCSPSIRRRRPGFMTTRQSAAAIWTTPVTDSSRCGSRKPARKRETAP